MSQKNTHHVVETLCRRLAAATGLLEEHVAALVRSPPKPDMGDYAFPCFELAKQQKKAPPELAKELAQRMCLDPKVNQVFAAVTAEGPFLNFKALPGVLNEAILRKVLDPITAFGHSETGENQTVIVEYSSPNIAKPFHVGHLMSTILGASLARIYKRIGYRVVSANHLGDWGTQCGFQFLAWQQSDPQEREEQLEKRGIDYLAELYIGIHAPGKRLNQLRELLQDQKSSGAPEERAQIQAELERLVPEVARIDAEARALFKKLEDGDSALRALWQRLRDKTLEVLQKSYDRLGVKFDSDAGEAFYEPHVKELVKDLKERGVLVQSEGAWVIPLDEPGAKRKRPPCIVIKSDGATKYETRDLAAALYRKKTYNFVKNIYVVDVRQNDHFSGFFKALEKAGYAWVTKECVHVAYGMMKISEGGQVRAMTTRGGQMVPLGDLLDSMVDIVCGIIAEKNHALSATQREAVAEAVGVGAIVFWVQSRRRNSDIVFDWKLATSPEGDTGPYVQYTHARACSILRKLAVQAPLEAQLRMLTQPEEVAVCKALERFPAVLLHAADGYEPSLLATWLIETARAFNDFYNKHQVLKAETLELTKARLVLVSAVRRMLAEGLALLGLAAPEEM